MLVLRIAHRSRRSLLLSILIRRLALSLSSPRISLSLALSPSASHFLPRRLSPPSSLSLSTSRSVYLSVFTGGLSLSHPRIGQPRSRRVRATRRPCRWTSLCASTKVDNEELERMRRSYVHPLGTHHTFHSAANRHGAWTAAFRVRSDKLHCIHARVTHLRRVRVLRQRNRRDRVIARRARPFLPFPFFRASPAKLRTRSPTLTKVRRTVTGFASRAGTSGSVNESVGSFRTRINSGSTEISGGPELARREAPGRQSCRRTK